MDLPTDSAARPAHYDRYRELDGLPERLRLTPTIEGQLQHRSVRAYTDDPLPEGTLETIIAAAQSAASSSNLQAWSVIAVTDPDLKAGLSALASNQGHIRRAPLFLVWLADLNRLTQVSKAHELPGEGLEFTEAYTLAVVDAALAAQNAMVALESLGLGAVYVGAMRNKPAEVAELLNLPPRVFAVFGMSVGIPDPARPTAVKPRLPQAAVLFRDRYDWGEAQRDAVRRYDRAMGEFQAEQAMPPQDWSRQAAGRVKDGAALSGRHVLRDVLNRLGFHLR